MFRKLFRKEFKEYDFEFDWFVETKKRKHEHKKITSSSADVDRLALSKKSEKQLGIPRLA